MLFAGLGSTNKSATSLILSNSRSVSPPSFLLPQTLWQELFSLSSCSIRRQWVLGHSFLPGNDAADELARRGAQLVPSAMPCSLFSRTGGALSHLNSLTHRFLPHAPCVLSHLRCNEHILLLSSYLSGIGRIETFSSKHLFQETSHLILLCPATNSLHRSLFGDSLSLYDLWSRPWRVARLLRLHGIPPSPDPSEGSGNNIFFRCDMFSSYGHEKTSRQLWLSIAVFTPTWVLTVGYCLYQCLYQKWGKVHKIAIM